MFQRGWSLRALGNKIPLQIETTTAPTRREKQNTRTHTLMHRRAIDMDVKISPKVHLQRRSNKKKHEGHDKTTRVAWKES